MSLDGIGRKKLEAKTVDELRALGSKLNISIPSASKKEEIIKLLLKSKRKPKDQRLSSSLKNRLTLLTQAELFELATRHKVELKKSLKKDEMITELLVKIKLENINLSLEELKKICTKLDIIDTAKTYSEADLKIILENSHVGSSRLKIATKKQLEDYCRLAELKTTGTKDELIERLIEDGIELCDLIAWHVRAIWKIECATAVDEKPPAKLDDVIVAICAAPASAPASTSAPKKDLSKKEPKTPEAKTAKKERAKKIHDELKAGLRPMAFSVDSPPISREEYRKLLSSFVVMGSDQDVFHIIAHANGGADHALNYHFAQNRAFNRAIGDRFDYINAFLAGLEQTRLAVEASKRWNGYKGPSAEELYKKGEEFWRARRHERRSEEKDKEQVQLIPTAAEKKSETQTDTIEANKQTKSTSSSPASKKKTPQKPKTASDKVTSSPSAHAKKSPLVVKKPS